MLFLFVSTSNGSLTAYTYFVGIDKHYRSREGTLTLRWTTTELVLLGLSMSVQHSRIPQRSEVPSLCLENTFNV